VKASGVADDVVGRIERSEQDCDIEFIREDAPKAVAQGLEGVQRVAHIVRAMKDFSHLDRGQVGLVDVNRALAQTLTVARNEYKYVADVETDFTDLPEIEGYTGELNQVFLNLIVNAAHAIADTGKRGKIRVRTQPLGDQIEVSISDTGPGIPRAIWGKIYDPFFTTKPVGKGTGQGLNITHQIIGKHGGTVRFETEEGKGTTFFITLPVRQARVGKEEGAGRKEEGSAVKAQGPA
jgi:two-component system, NtrC family, sensor kinase